MGFWGGGIMEFGNDGYYGNGRSHRAILPPKPPRSNQTFPLAGKVPIARRGETAIGWMHNQNDKEIIMTMTIALAGTATYLLIILTICKALRVATENEDE